MLIITETDRVSNVPPLSALLTNVHSTPYAAEFRRLGVPHELFAEELSLHYETRAGLFCRIYPKLFFCAARAAVRSLILSRPKPDIVVIKSDVEAIVFGLFAFLFSRRTRIVFETFIAAERGSPLKRRLQHLHYSLVLRFVDVAICHSATEARDYVAQFPRTRAVFTALPFGLSVDGREALRASYGEAAAASNVIVSAGRSARDYATLAKAVAGLPCRVRVICDWERPTVALENMPEVTIVRNCFRSEYLAELARARIVVVPLSQRRISAGQMVMQQAFALGKPVVITDTPTTREYAIDGRDALLSEFGDADDLRAKIVALLGDPARCAELGERGSERYDLDFSTEAYVRNLVRLLSDIVDQPRTEWHSMPTPVDAKALAGD